jgi:hypothetical protein
MHCARASIAAIDIDASSTPVEEQVTRVARFGAFVLGASLLAFLVIHSGPAVLWRTITGSAWVIAPIVAIWGVVYACSARAWQLVIPDRPRAFTFSRAFLLTISSFAMNFTTPALSLGGEPLKMAGAVPFLGRSRAVGSVVSFRFLHAVSHMLVLLLAIIPAAIILPHTAAVRAVLGATALIAAGIATFLLSSHREGIFERGVALIGSVRPLRGMAARLERHRGQLEELDRELSAVHTAPGHFRWALAAEVLGRIVGTMEYAVILDGLGLGINIPRAFVVANIGSLFTMTMFFMPFEIGAKEGGTFLIFGWLGLNPALGTSAALLSRVRELAWAAIGIVTLLLLDVGKRQTPSPATEREE